MPKEVVSVIITAFNSEKYIREAIDSVLAQSYFPLEIIVVDDGSSDGTVDILKSYGNRIRLFQKPNGGPASARNFGIAQVSGNYIAFLDADDIWLKEKIERQMKVMESDPKIGMVYTEQKNFLDGKFGLKIQKPIVNGNIFKHVFWGNFIGPSMVLVKRECFDRLGVFNERRDFIGVEDYDMWLRITKEYEVGCISDELVYYRIHTGGISKKIDQIYSNERSVLEEAQKRWPNLEQEAGISLSKRFSKHYLDYGLDFLERGQLLQAREKFVKSLNYHWANIASWKNLLKSLVPLWILKNLRQFMRRGQTQDTLYHSSVK